MKLPRVFFVRIYRENARVRNDSTRAASPPERFRADIARAEDPSEEILFLSCTMGAKIRESVLAFSFENLPKIDAKRKDLCGRCTNETKENTVLRRYWAESLPAHIFVLDCFPHKKTHSIVRHVRTKVTNCDCLESMKFENPSKKVSAMETSPKPHAHERVIVCASCRKNVFSSIASVECASEETLMFFNVVEVQKLPL